MMEATRKKEGSMVKIFSFTEYKTENGQASPFEGINFDALPLPERSPEEEALYAAQELAYDAWDAATSEESIALAQKALEISPFCVDAYNILADHSRTYNNAVVLYQKAAAIGEHSLGEDFFQAYMGDFWGILETRPYMRARAGIVECLLAFDDKKSAIKHCKELLKLCPNDNLGMRYILMALLLETGKNSQAETLYKRYKKDYSAIWFYARSLLDFRKHGDGDIANASLQAAFAINKFVPDYLLQKKKIPAATPPYYSPGNRDEAILLAKDYLPAWQASEGAMQWLDKTCQQYMPKRKKSKTG